MWIISKLFGKKYKGFTNQVKVENVSQPIDTNKVESNNAKLQVMSNETGEPSSDESVSCKMDSNGQNTTNASFKEHVDATTSVDMNVYHLIVLDESGSMRGITQQTISGCNETIQTIRVLQENSKNSQKHFLSIYLFDSGNSRYIIKDKDIEKVREITSKDYRPNACTPLFDVLGVTLTTLKTTIEKTKSVAYVTIITDGYENASREYTLEKVQYLIDDLKKQDVIFSFIGANVDSASYAQSLHINNAMRFEQTDEGTRGMWERERRSKLRSSGKLRVFSKFMPSKTVYFGVEENLGNYYAEEVPAERISPSKVETLKENEIFVFGSNTTGKHLGGAAYYAVTHFSAVQGQAEGRQGQSYAIPTDGVTEEELYQAINRFCDYAAAHPELTFLVTAVGCGAAGLTPYIVGPMFRRASQMANVKLPAEFWDYNDYTQ